MAAPGGLSLLQEPIAVSHLSVPAQGTVFGHSVWEQLSEVGALTLWPQGSECALCWAPPLRVAVSIQTWSPTGL